MALSVFISYSTQDLHTASVIRQWVDHAGGRGFLAEYAVQPGSALAPTIEEAIRGCDLFLLLWSANARGSEWVPQEVGIAKGVQKPILPIVLHKDIGLPGFIKTVKYLPLYPDSKAAMLWLHSEIVQRVKTKDIQSAVGFGILTAIVAGVIAANSKD